MEQVQARAPICLTYCSLPYRGRGWPQTCASILAEFDNEGLAPIFVLPRLRRRLPASITAPCGLKYPLNKMPWRWVSKLAAARTSARFRELLDRADPATTIAYLWPGVPKDLVEHARRLGIITVREMINTYQGTAKRILDQAYERAGVVPAHGISARDVSQEAEELWLYDYIFAPAPGVEVSLAEAGIPRERVLAGSYGWTPERFGPTTPIRSPDPIGVRLLFVGIVGVRKGIPELLEAWRRSRVKGKLVLVGEIEPGLERDVLAAVEAGGVQHIPFTTQLAAYYGSSDVFVFPTHEEGCPQVVMEAAGCGLPVITTPMGAGRLVEHGVNGLWVSSGSVAELAAAIRKLAHDPRLRHNLAFRMHSDAQAFTYQRIGQDRARIFKKLLALRHRKAPNLNEPFSQPLAVPERRAGRPDGYGLPELL
ncbi:glycosyltransferase [Pelagibacterium sp. H642]|uniref:glycosyltransferase n=1 Tax=Pelagibacterium sp. H642 TaxID=1881069 RepID=UPI002815C604|nr:glycosyltransferase [Pelagibacterium sp. H642]WMT92954.1 glycosyltransferase [Pelagibacterium sp. H642]